MNYKLAYKEDGHFDGFYLDCIHTNIPVQHIAVDEELWQELLSKMYKFKSTENLYGSEIYTYNLDDLEIFEEYTLEQPEEPHELTLYNRVITLEQENIELLRSNFDLDFRVFEIECALEDSTVSTMKLNSLSRASRTQYDLAKKLIILGEYDKEDMIYELSRYADRGVITPEQYDELIALMNDQTN